MSSTQKTATQKAIGIAAIPVCLAKYYKTYGGSWSVTVRI